MLVREVKSGAMVSLLKRSLSGTSNPEYFVRYVSVGAAVVGVDVTSFQALVMLRVPLPLTTTIAFCLGTLVHFVLNKLWTFRVRSSPRGYQVTAYVGVLLASFVVQQLVIETLVLDFHAVPIAAKVVAIVVQLPVSFFGHRYLTFREGRELNT
jgi:putative flippase GtrA